MNSKKRITAFALQRPLIAVSAALLAGCATPLTPEQEEANRLAAEQERNHYEKTIPTCASAEECQAKFVAARRWVLDYCDFKLEHVKDDFLETYHSGDEGSTDMWCRVSKEPTGKPDEYRMPLEAGVNNPFWQGVPSLLTRQSYNDAVNAATHPAK